MSSREKLLYPLVMRDAVENVLIAAVRRAIDTQHLNVAFDVDLGAGPHQQHTLTISVRDDPSLVVTATGIAHEWLPIATGFIDLRFSRLVTGLLADLVNKAQESGRFI